MTDDSADDAAVFGASSDVLASIRPAETHFEVWEENAEVFGLFLRLRTQWRIINSVITGLEYQSVIALMDLFGVADRHTVFDDIQAMELAALTEMNKGKD